MITRFACLYGLHENRGMLIADVKISNKRTEQNHIIYDYRKDCERHIINDNNSQNILCINVNANVIITINNHNE